MRCVATVESNGEYLHLVALSCRLQHEESPAISNRTDSRTSLRLPGRYRARKRDDRFGGGRRRGSCSLAPFNPCASCRSEAVQLIKGGSSHWLKQTFPDTNDFAWQDAYAAFTVSQSQLNEMQGYIRSQREHHRTKTFVEEYRAFLAEHPY